MIAEIGRLQIKLRFSFVAAVTLMLYFCEERVVLCTFLASLFHESGHLVFMLIYKADFRKIELGAFGICIERNEASLISYKKEAMIALGGIIFNTAACMIFYMTGKSLVNDSFILFAAVNLLVALINSLPSSFLDMGRAINFLLLSCTKEENANRIMNVASHLTAVMLTCFFVVYTAFYGFNISLLAVTIYLNLITFKGRAEK